MNNVRAQLSIVANKLKALDCLQAISRDNYALFKLHEKRLKDAILELEELEKLLSVPPAVVPNPEPEPNKEPEGEQAGQTTTQTPAQEGTEGGDTPPKEPEVSTSSDSETTSEKEAGTEGMTSAEKLKAKLKK